MFYKAEAISRAILSILRTRSLKGSTLLFAHYSRQPMENFRKVFVRQAADEGEVMRISFLYEDSSFPVRQFNFLRPKSEQLCLCLHRMKCKIEDVKRKRTNKKKKQKNTEEEDTITASLEFSFERDGTKFSGDLSNSEAWKEGSYLNINEIQYEVLENRPCVLTLNLPKNIMSGFPVYPKVSLEFANKNDCKFTWYRPVSKDEREQYHKDELEMDNKSKYWTLIGQDYFYIPSDSDVNHKLKVVCIPKSGDLIGLADEVVSLNEVSSGPGKCPFDLRHEFTGTLTAKGSIRCVSYNILADIYAYSDVARNQLFPYCPAEYLQLDYRRQLYLKEILGYNSDLICLQEVDKKVFHNDLIPLLDFSGFEGIFTEKGKQAGEGLACFFRSSKFRLVNSESVMLHEALEKETLFQDIWQKVTENEKLQERMITRSTALQVIVLEPLDVPRKLLIVGHTHLYFHPESANIRLLQAAVCIRNIENTIKKLKLEDPSANISLIISGDFNSCPQFGLYRFMTQGTLPADCDDWHSNPEEAVTGMPLEHSLHLSSAYGTPAYTNYTEEFVGCLDYIFHDKDALSVSELVPLPSHEQVSEHRGLPNKFFPSDHLALVCTVTWK